MDLMVSLPFFEVTGGMTLDFGHWEHRCRHFGASCHVFLVNIWSYMVLRQIPNGIIPVTDPSPLFTACPPSVSHRHTVRCDDGDEAGEAWSDEAGVLWRLSRLWAALGGHGGHLQDMSHVSWAIDASDCTPIDDMYNIIDYLPIGSMYAIYANIYHQYTPNVSIYTINGSYGLYWCVRLYNMLLLIPPCWNNQPLHVWVPIFRQTHINLWVHTHCQVNVRVTVQTRSQRRLRSDSK